MPSRSITASASLAVAPLARAASRSRRAAHQHDLLDGDREVPVDRLELRDVAERARRLPLDGRESTAARVDVDRAEDRAQQRRLARAARARPGRRSRRLVIVRLTSLMTGVPS